MNCWVLKACEKCDKFEVANAGKQLSRTMRSGVAGGPVSPHGSAVRTPCSAAAVTAAPVARCGPPKRAENGGLYWEAGPKRGLVPFDPLPEWIGKESLKLLFTTKMVSQEAQTHVMSTGYNPRCREEHPPQPNRAPISRPLTSVHKKELISKLPKR